jgi:hypothetical protein
MLFAKMSLMANTYLPPCGPTKGMALLKIGWQSLRLAKEQFVA